MSEENPKTAADAPAYAKYILRLTHLNMAQGMADGLAVIAALPPAAQPEPCECDYLRESLSLARQAHATTRERLEAMLSEPQPEPCDHQKAAREAFVRTQAARFAAEVDGSWGNSDGRAKVFETWNAIAWGTLRQIRDTPCAVKGGRMSSDWATIPPTPGKDACDDEVCPWCLDDLRTQTHFRKREGYPRDVCRNTPADVEKVCRDIAAEYEPLKRETCKECDGLGGDYYPDWGPCDFCPKIPGVNRCYGYFEESDDERFRRVLLESAEDTPKSVAAREIASLLRDIRQSGGASHAQALAADSIPVESSDSIGSKLAGLAALVFVLLGCAPVEPLEQPLEVQPGGRIVIDPDGTVWRDRGPDLSDYNYTDPFEGLNIDDILGTQDEEVSGRDTSSPPARD